MMSWFVLSSTRQKFIFCLTGPAGLREGISDSQPCSVAVTPAPLPASTAARMRSGTHVTQVRAYLWISSC